MTRSLVRGPVMAAAAAAAVLIAGTAPLVAEPHTRTLYVTVTDSQGKPLTDLTAADFQVKEGGKERTIDKVEPATERLHLLVMVQDRLAGIDGVHVGLGQLIEPLLSQSDVTLITVALKNNAVIENASSAPDLVKAINAMGRNPAAADEHIVEGVFDAAKEIEKSGAKRSAIVVCALSGPQVSSMSANQTLDELAHSGAVMYTAAIETGATQSGTTTMAQSGQSFGTLGEDSDKDHVLGDGPKQSGGRHEEITGNRANGLGGLLGQFGNELAHQYAITYTLPDGVKLDSRVSISLKRKGATLHAPSRVPDK